MKTLVAILFCVMTAGTLAVGCAHGNKDKKSEAAPDMAPAAMRPPPAQ